MEASEKSLTILREINNRIQERHFHEHTHVLYDIRTKLGPDVKTYVEIGSYVGSSASLILSHPFPTRVICIDPCALNPNHYNGKLNQYDTIFNNLSAQQSINLSVQETSQGTSQNTEPQDSQVQATSHPEQTQAQDSQSEQTQAQDSQSEQTQAQDTQSEQTQVQETSHPEQTQVQEISHPEQTQAQDTQSEQTQDTQSEQTQDTQSEQTQDTQSEQTQDTQSEQTQKEKASQFEILKGYSSDKTILDKLRDVSVDLLFIDGGHGYQQVLDDFNNYAKFVSDDGYIVFDDYLDDEHSPDVRVAVNKIVRELDTNKFQVIGAPANKFGAIPTHPNRFAYLNEFIIRKKSIKYFAIVIPTYKRKNGTTVQNMKNIVEFLSKQTYQNYHVFLVGDHYEDEEEFKYLASLFPQDKIYSHNNATSYRKDYFSSPANKWCIGGLMALKHGVEKAKEYGFKYYLHLDDDDSWSHDKLHVHRQILEQFPEADFVFHASEYCGGVLPREHREYPLTYNNLRPRHCNLVHSSNCLSLDDRSYNVFMDFTNNVTEIAEKIKNKEIPEYNLEAFDAQFIVQLNSNSLTCLYIPKVLSVKMSDVNIPE